MARVIACIASRLDQPPAGGRPHAGFSGASQLHLPFRPAVVATCRPRRQRPTKPPRPACSQQAVQLVLAYPNRPRRHRPVNPHAAANALALEHRDIAQTVADNISRRTGHPREDLEQIAMLGILQAARRFSPERGSFRPYARTYANGEVYHYLRDKGFLIKVPASWRELHARGQRLIRLGTPAADVAQQLKISSERWSEIMAACKQRVVALDANDLKRSEDSQHHFS